ncbi:MAG: nuclear transport factor 2 family protein [Candidatus Kapaibacterium sp.]
MKFLRIALISAAIATLLFGCGNQQEMRNPDQSIKEVTELLENTRQHYIDKNVEGLTSQFANVDYFSDYSSEKDARITNYNEFVEMYKTAFARDFKYETLEYENLRVHAHGDIAWFGTDIKSVVVMDTVKTKMGGRLTGVLQNFDGTWKYVQSHYNQFAKDDCCEDSTKPECKDKHKSGECDEHKKTNADSKK